MILCSSLPKRKSVYIRPCPRPDVAAKGIDCCSFLETIQIILTISAIFRIFQETEKQKQIKFEGEAAGSVVLTKVPIKGNGMKGPDV